MDKECVHSIHTHSVHNVHTVYSQTHTNVNAKSRWLSCVIFLRLQESIFRSAMSHPCWSFPHLLTSSPPQHAAISGPRDLLQDNTVHRQSLPPEPLQPLPEQLPHEPLPANDIRSENNAKESRSDSEYESAGNLRMNTPTGHKPKVFTILEQKITARFYYFCQELKIYYRNRYSNNS